MKVSEFQRLPEVAPLPKEARIGEPYLQGEKMIEQKMTKRVGDEITFYVVEDVSDNGYLSSACYQKLEE